MVYQEELRESQVLALWVGELADEDSLVTYLGEGFERDFGFLLDDDEAPEFTYSFETQRHPPDLTKRHCRASTVPFDRDVEVRKLIESFSRAGPWVSDAVRQCHEHGINTATIAVAFMNLRYRPELCRNSQTAFRFVGNFSWPEGLARWEESEKLRLVKPPFPKLIRKDFGEAGSGLFHWNGIVRLESWNGFASYAELSADGWMPSRGVLPDGDLRLCVHPASSSVREPTDEQARSFEQLIENENALQVLLSKAIYEAYPKWRQDYYGSQISSDGGKTWQTGWELPEMFPPGNMPEIVCPDDLRHLIRPESIHVMANPKDGFTRIGFGFSCRWDEEHGLGVSTHNGRVIEIGSAEEAFAEYFSAI